MSSRPPYVRSREDQSRYDNLTMQLLDLSKKWLAWVDLKIPGLPKPQFRTIGVCEACRMVSELIHE